MVVTGRTIAVNRLVGQLLAGSCRWRDVVPSAGAVVETVRLLCPMCGDLREVGVSRWLRGMCECGLPVVRQMRSTDEDHRTCCGYWGPAIALGRRTGGRTGGGPIAAGHWCLSA